jgi:hypothetical protein
VRIPAALCSVRGTRRWGDLRTAIHLAAEQAFQRGLNRKNWRAVAEEAQEEFQKGFEAGWEETQGVGGDCKAVTPA